MSWRTSLAGVAVAVFVLTGCGDDPPASALTQVAVYDFDGRPDVIIHEGRPLVINFFAESCPPCVAEMPAFESVYERVGDRVDFIGVSEDATSTAGRRIVAATGITYRTVWDGDGTAFSQFEALGMPTTVFVTAAGDIVDVHTGALSEDELATKVAELFD